MTKPAERLFTYGTLRKGEQNPMQEYLQKNSTWLGRAQFHGKLYFADGHPAAVSSNDDESVILGDLFECNRGKGLLKELDRYEGYHPDDTKRSLYIRKMRTVTLEESGKMCKAWIYLYNQPIKNATHISSGDYRKFSQDLA